MRIGGLASGMDTESIVNDLMKAERIPLDKLTQKKQYFEWQLNDYRTANRDLKDYSTKLFDNSILSKNFNAKNVKVSDPSVVDIRSKGNAEDFSGTLTVEQLATNATMQGTKLATGTTDGQKLSTLGVTADTVTISIKAPGMANAKELTFSKDDNISKVMKDITSATGVRAFFDVDSGQIGISSKESGNGAITISDVNGGNLASTLGISGSSSDPGKGTNGTDAKFTYNGLTTSRSSNTFEIDGMEITLKGKSVEPITFNATTDTEKVFDNIKGFVDDYNKLIEDLNKKIREPIYRSFQPLSAEQKKELSDKEVEQWEEKAMSGTLRNDPELKSMLTKLRNIMTNPIELGDGTKISLSDIGIKTSNNYLDNGKLVIDEKKLKEAIAQNPQGIEKLFNNDSKDGGGTGIARQLRAEVDSTQKNIQKSAGKLGDTNKSFSLGRTLDNMNKQIERFETRLQMSETRYWKQFNAMENAIQRANAQSASLMSSLGGGM
ncbi:flagellar hook-associated protein 2 [Sporosarcina sp. BI001-red]|uniref:flagellar hook-associated protein 2 n=1 Tax=Sporosarcina sp. BI001-red TaxID=2282866 RepID=UPI000E237EA5|nr:flagellar hook-associated protein 2 [Sporosarcina sp. BI001-red]REB11167.1 flagellar hook-associated protein 2 [Sporosarcina sp. BI001-red]